MDNEFSPNPGKWTVSFIPADEISREFLLPVRAGYGILERAARVVKRKAFYYFSTTFGCRDLPRFAAICQVEIFILEFMTRYDMPADAPLCGIFGQEGALSDSDQNFICVPREYLPQRCG